MKKGYIFIIIVLISLMLTGCVPGDGTYTLHNPANFLSGIWHGWIAPITLIGSYFDKNIHMFEPINTGFSYEFGFYIAVISGFGGLSLTRKKYREK